MARGEPQHERIRFRRDEIADLDALPSARSADPPAAPLRLHGLARKIARRLAIAASVAVFLFFVLAAALYGIGASGIAQEQMRAAAERAIEQLAGRDINVRIADASISLDGAHLIGLDVEDVGLRAAGQSQEFVRAATLSFGVELMPLLSGRIVPTSARVADAVVDPGAFGSQAQFDYLAGLRDGRGLIAPDRLPPAVFGALRGLFDALAKDGATELELQNVTLKGEEGSRFVLTSAALHSETPQALALAAQGSLGARSWRLEGSAARADAGTISDLRISLTAEEPPAGDEPFGVGALEAELTGSDAGSPRLGLKASASQIRLTLGPQPQSGQIVGDASLEASVTEGKNQVEIDRLRLATGASAFDLSGGAGPLQESAGSEAVYRYELSGDDLVLAAQGSPEPPLRFKGALGGTFDPQARTLVADRLNVVTDGGSADAQARVRFEPGETPAVDFSLAVRDMPVAHAKQLWPWTAARGAWTWAQQHLRGGIVTAGAVEYHVLPGHIGNGVPPTPDQVSGSFTVAGTSFDTAGALPPVTDASGTIAFRGTDADITLSGGSMTLPSGDVLRAADTRLALHEGGPAPLIGKLDGEISGSVAAMAELISLDPIDAAGLPFKPADLSGSAVAHVKADIPLEKDVPRDALEWLVIADFDKLALATPLDGQTLSEAKGTLSAEPSSVQVTADARLNGLPAKLDIVEPLKPDGPQRRRDVELTLDDKARETLAPGFRTLMSGPVTLTVDAAAPEKKVRADLSDARLDLPWIGWSKGAGIPASADFLLTKDGDATRVSKLQVSGQSFSVGGDLAFAAGSIRSARLSNVQLNRGDRIAVDIDRKGAGYAVAIRGDAFDGRALVKASTSVGKPDASGASGPPLSLKARIGTVAGFGGEALKDFALSLESAGGTRTLSASAVTDRGGAVSMEDETKGAGRSLAMTSADAGSVLRFFGIYPNMQGGAIEVALSSSAGGPLQGDVAARNFVLVNEPRLASLVSSKPAGGDRSLNEAVKKTIDTSRVTFDRASATVTKGPDFLTVKDGVLRSSAIGSTFQGTLYDAGGRMDMTGTFMPAYGLNRLFGELPLIGVILGNGNDRGLLGVTFKLEGNAKSPTVTVNPLSIIAPGIFRRIFEFAD